MNTTNTIEEILKKFEKLTPGPKDISDSLIEQYAWVEDENNNKKHLYENYAYSEPMYTLDCGKVKNFIKQSLLEVQQEGIKQGYLLHDEIEQYQMKKFMGGFEWKNDEEMENKIKEIEKIIKDQFDK